MSHFCTSTMSPGFPGYMGLFRQKGDNNLKDSICLCFVKRESHNYTIFLIPVYETSTEDGSDNQGACMGQWT